MIFLTGIVHLILDCFISKICHSRYMYPLIPKILLTTLKKHLELILIQCLHFPDILPTGCIYYVCIAILMCIVHECNCYPVYWSPASNHLDALRLISTFVYRQLRLDKFNFLIGDNCIAIVWRKYILLMMRRVLNKKIVRDCF